jgi:hypothetical protein
MLVACRLAGLSALEMHYAGANGRAQCGAAAMTGSQRVATATVVASAAVLAPSLQLIELKSRIARPVQEARLNDSLGPDSDVSTSPSIKSVRRLATE